MVYNYVMNDNLEAATFGGGCFWCTEAIFKRLKGVASVTSGYSGGSRSLPSYEQVTTGATGHAESVNILFDPKIISFDRLLDVFWATHNPTIKNQQGNDVGTQYRSVIFYHNDKQRDEAIASMKRLGEEKVYKNSVVTEIAPFTGFYSAEEYHQGYYDNNTEYPYCSLVISPKITKLLEKFGSDVKEEFKIPSSRNDRDSGPERI